jgi:hypothetical protein
MDAFRPLSKRGTADPRFDGPQEGLPSYLVDPVISWTRGAIFELRRNGQFPRRDVVERIQLALRMRSPLEWRNGAQSAARSLLERMKREREFAIDVIDFLVQEVTDSAYANRLDQILTEGGSVWEVARTDKNKRFLARRVSGPVSDVIQSVSQDSERVGNHLEAAWQKLLGRQPDPSAAYREAIRAVEVAAKPVITPSDPTATLGKMIRAIEDKPEKWTVALDKGSSRQIAEMANLIWKGQLDRHGTDDPKAPLHVSQEEADMAVNIAIALARIFTSGGIRTVD